MDIADTEIAGRLAGGAWIVLQVFLGLLLADFLSGLLHWLQDRYGEADWPIVGRAIDEAERHHVTPMRMLTRTPYERNGRVVFVTGLFGLLFWATGTVGPLTITTLIFGAFTNEIHAFAHRRILDCPRPVKWLQRIGIMQSQLHHAAHHRGAKDRAYCIVTNYLNPVLDGTGFWRAMERAMALVFRLKTRAALRAGSPNREGRLS